VNKLPNKSDYDEFNIISEGQYLQIENITSKNVFHQGYLFKTVDRRFDIENITVI